MPLILSIALAAIALLVAFSARGAAKRAQEQLDEQRRNATAKGADTDELKESLDGLRKLVAAMASGRAVDADMVKENRLYRNAKPADMQKDLAGSAPACVIDVRTPQEWAGGHIVGALHIPVDDINKRLHEVPRDGRKLFVICAGGGRSSAAASFLANRGYLNVHNVEGGMGAWRGDVVRD